MHFIVISLFVLCAPLIAMEGWSLEETSVSGTQWYFKHKSFDFDDLPPKG